LSEPVAPVIVVPFWLKALNFPFGMLSAGGEVTGEPHFDGDRLLVALLTIAFVLGAATGVLFISIWAYLREFSARISRHQPTPWERLVRRALRFVQKRRAIGVAFNNLGNYDLRPSSGSRPTTIRQRRAATPAGPRTARTNPTGTPTRPSILHEGPAISYGPYRG
jgi:hypothetical protein